MIVNRLRAEDLSNYTISMSPYAPPTVTATAINVSSEGYKHFEQCQDIIDRTINRCFIAATKLSITKVIFNPPATIVFWNDGTKTVVKAQDEVFDWEKGLAMAICKRYLADNKGRYYNVFREYEAKGKKATDEAAVDLARLVSKHKGDVLI